jgi:hypothetical protein
MAYDISNLALIAHGNNNKVYRYTTTADTLATVLASGYFGKDSTTLQQSSDMLDAGDILFVSASDGLANLRVDSVSGTTVTTEMGSGETQWIVTDIENLFVAAAKYVAAPFDGVIRRAKVITNGEVQTTIGAIRVLKGGTLVTGLSFSIDQSGQGAGEVYQSVATGANTVSEGDAVQIAWDKMGDAEINANEADACVMIEFVPA